MKKGWDPAWREYVPPTRGESVPPTAPPGEAPRRKAPRVKGAQRVYVDPVLRILLDPAHVKTLAKSARARLEHIHSTREALRYLALLLEQDAGAIRNLRRQVVFPLHVRRPDSADEQIGTWTADFNYERWYPETRLWIREVEDAKGHKTELYLRSKKHVQAQYGIAIRET